MATIEKRKTSKNQISYRVKIRILGQAPINKTFSSLTLAKKWANKIETEIEEGRYFPIVHSKGKTLTDLVESYLGTVQLNNKRRINELHPIMGWWAKEYGHRLLTECTGVMFLEAQQKLASKPTKKTDENGKRVMLSNSTVNRYMTALNSALNFSVNVLKWLPLNPMADVKKLNEPTGRTRFLSPDEINRLMHICVADENRNIFAAVLLGISTGRRKSAIMRIKWEDIDLETGRIRFWESKTKSFQLSTVSGPTLEILKQRRACASENARLVFPSAVNSAKAIDLTKAWRRVLRDAAISDFRFHDLRHTCASYLAMNGASLMEVANVLGHKTLDMVKRYAHFAEDHTASIQKRMNEKVLGNVKI